MYHRNNNDNRIIDDKERKSNKLTTEWQQNVIWKKLLHFFIDKFSGNQDNYWKVTKAFGHWFLIINQDNWECDPKMPHLPLYQPRRHEANVVLQSILRNYFPNEKYDSFFENNFIDTLWNEIDELKEKQAQNQLPISIRWSAEKPEEIFINKYKYTNSRMGKIMNKFDSQVDQEIIARLVLTYHNPFLINSTQCIKETPEVADLLYNTFHVRFEAFSSIFDTVFFDKDDVKWCSLFYDIERHFGSLGNFFLLDLSQEEFQGSWQVHPPFVESIINEMAMKLLQALKYQEIKSCFYITLPTWKDLFGIQCLRQSRFCLAIFEDIETQMNCPKRDVKIKKNVKMWKFVVGHPMYLSSDFHLLKEAYELGCE